MIVKEEFFNTAPDDDNIICCSRLAFILSSLLARQSRGYVVYVSLLRKGNNNRVFCVIILDVLR